MQRRRVFLAGLSIVLQLVAVWGLLSLLGRPVHAADCTVTSTLDSGPGSLRACMAQLAAGDVITFDTGTFPPGNPQTIVLNSALPTIVTNTATIDGSNAGVILDGSGTPTDTRGLAIDNASNVVIKGLQILDFPGRGIELRNGASNNTIGGTNGSPGGSCSGDCNLISGNGSEGVFIYGSGTMSNIVSGNYIGTDANGTAALPNADDGIEITDGASYNVIGGDTAGERNIISGHNNAGMDGIALSGNGTMSNTVKGNYIGTDASGTSALPNGCGVDIRHDASGNVISDNLISGNGLGVTIRGSGTMSNTLSGNKIGTDVSGTFALPNTGSLGVFIRQGTSHNTISNNLISGNSGYGVGIGDGASNNNRVIGNYIGTDISGTSPIGNARNGVTIGQGGQHNVIGGDTAAERNLISGNGNDGVYIFSSGTMSNTVSGNYIGTNASGTAAISNAGNGVSIADGAQYNVIGGDTAGERNIISGHNNMDGIVIGGNGTMSNTVKGNYIGTDASGTSALPNGCGVDILRASGNIVSDNLISGNGNGVTIRRSEAMNNTLSGNKIGTDASGTFALPNTASFGVFIRQGTSHNTISNNLISGNSGTGVGIVEAGTSNNRVIGNYIGTDISGTSPISNAGNGVLIAGGAQYNVIGGDTAGERNLISGNGTAGVHIKDSGTIRNTITQNSIYSNTGKGIELVDGGNLELFPPLLTDLLADTVKGLAPPNSTVEIFSDDEDEGRIFEGSTTADATSHFTFNKPSGLTGPHTTATATDVDGNTSEFSTAYSVTHDMELVAIFSVKSRVQAEKAVTPTVEVGNAGSSTEVNVPVRVRVTTDPGGTEVYSKIETVSSIGPLAYAFVTFDAWTPAPGDYTFEASVMLPGDENGANDTKAVAVTAVAGNPEAYIKDNPQDDGSVPTSNYWMSPDIWVRHEEDGGEEHQQPIANQTNYAYARIHNIGDVTQDNVMVDLYWHEPALAIKCGSWRHIGQYTISSLDPGVTETIHLPWTPDVSGHTCLFAQIDSDQDPYARDHDCYEGVPWDNNLAQRNVEVVESAASEVGAVSVAGIRLDVVNVRSKPASVDVVVEKMEAFTGTLTLDLGEELFNRWQNATAGTVEGGQVVSGTTKVQITAPVSGTVVGLPFYGDEEVEVVLEAEGESGLEFGVDVKEWMDGLLIGGNTYLMSLPYERIYLPIILKGHSGS